MAFKIRFDREARRSAPLTRSEKRAVLRNGEAKAAQRAAAGPRNFRAAVDTNKLRVEGNTRLEQKPPSRLQPARSPLGLRMGEILPPTLRLAQNERTQLDPSDAKPRSGLDFWDKFEHDVGQAMYRNALARGRPKVKSAHDEWLEKLGVGWHGRTPIIAKPSVILQRIEAHYNRLGVPRNERLRAAVIFYVPPKESGDGTYVSRFFREPIPPGAQPRLETLTPSLFSYFQAKGVMPIGGAENAYLTNVSGFEHDLAHLTADMQRPSFMRERHRAWAADTGDFLSGPRQGPLGQRRYSVSELLTFIPPSRHRALKALMRLPDRYDTAQGIKPLLWHVKSLSDEAYRDTVLALSQHANQLTVALGGGARDAGAAVGHRLVEMQMFKASIPDFVANKLKARDDRWLAGVQFALLTLAKLTPEQWLREGMREARKGDLLSDLFIKSGVLNVYRDAFTFDPDEP